MKLVTFEVESILGSQERLGAIVEDKVFDLNLCYAFVLLAQQRTARCYEIADAVIPTNMVEFFRGGTMALDAARETIEIISGSKDLVGPKGEKLVHDLNSLRLLAPVTKPNSIRDTLSFEGHMINFERRTGKPTPPRWYETPIYYKGNTSTIIGHEAPVSWPDYTEKLDYELEFGIYIGTEGVNIKEEDAHKHIAGYTIFNDISARDVIPGEVAMFLGPAKGKDMDTGNVMGPCIVTPDELDVSNLDMEARINGEVWSKGNSNDMYWSFPQIIAYVSRDETLYPGDFIGSGTIANGCGDEMEKWIQPGDVVELEVEGIGILRNTIVRN